MRKKARLAAVPFTVIYIVIGHRLKVVVCGFKYRQTVVGIYCFTCENFEGKKTGKG